MHAQLHIIRDEADYKVALVEYEGYFDNEPVPGSPEGERFELLGLLLSKYEDDTTPIDADPVATICMVMEQRGYDRRALNEVMGSKSRASEFLNRKRELTLAQIRRIHFKWRVPTDALIGRMDEGETQPHVD